MVVLLRSIFQGTARVTKAPSVIGGELFSFELDLFNKSWLSLGAEKSSMRA